MAQSPYAIQYIGAIEVQAGVEYTSASIISTYPTATVMKLKQKTNASDDGKPVRVSVNKSPMFEVAIDDESFIATGMTFVFSKDCIVAVGIYKVVV